MRRNNVLQLFLVIIFIALSETACSNREKSVSKAKTEKNAVKPYIGDYKNEFDDKPDLHAQAAKMNGISPLDTRADTIQYMKKGLLIRIATNTELYEVDKLKYSIPFLVPSAAKLLVEISKNFRDSLNKKKLTHYRLIITSVTRTEEDVENLMKRNRNAVPESAHLYGTTFDVSWKRYDKTLSESHKNVPTDKLKYILGQVLYNLKNEDRCYVKHERRQACFHITVR